MCLVETLVGAPATRFIALCDVHGDSVHDLAQYSTYRYDGGDLSAQSIPCALDVTSACTNQ
jgi:hypothetical protein